MTDRHETGIGKRMKNTQKKGGFTSLLLTARLVGLAEIRQRSYSVRENCPDLYQRDSHLAENFPLAAGVAL